MQSNERHALTPALSSDEREKLLAVVERSRFDDIARFSDRRDWGEGVPISKLRL